MLIAQAKAMGFPKPSIKRMNLGVAATSGSANSFIRSFFPTIDALIHLAGRRIYADILHNRIAGHGVKDYLKYNEVSPFAKASVNSSFCFDYHILTDGHVSHILNVLAAACP